MNSKLTYLSQLSKFMGIIANLKNIRRFNGLYPTISEVRIFLVKSQDELYVKTLIQLKYFIQSSNNTPFIVF